MLDFKETKISFIECEESKTKVVLPTGSYDIKHDSVNDKNVETNEFIFSKGDKNIILNFKYELGDEQKDQEFGLIKFKINAEYTRLKPNIIEYFVEIKFKIPVVPALVSA